MSFGPDAEASANRLLVDGEIVSGKIKAQGFKPSSFGIGRVKAVDLVIPDPVRGDTGEHARYDMLHKSLIRDIHHCVSQLFQHGGHLEIWVNPAELGDIQEYEALHVHVDGISEGLKGQASLHRGDLEEAGAMRFYQADMVIDGGFHESRIPRS